MAKLHVRTAPYRSDADVRRHFTRLKRSGCTALSLLHPIESGAILSSVLEQAKGAEIAIRALHTHRGDLFRDGGVQRALRTHYPPNASLFLRWIPLESIVFESSLNTPADYLALRANVSEYRFELTQLNADYRVLFKARLTFSRVDGAMLASLCEHLVLHCFGEINLVFEFPRLSAGDARALKRELAAFSRYPIARHASIRITGLPFCFLPPAHFRILYRAIEDVVPISGEIFVQRALIRRIKEAKHRYHEPCRSCRRRAACYAISPVQAHPEYRRYLTPRAEQTVVFAGGSLTPSDIRRFRRKDLLFVTPAEQGDAMMAILEGFRALLLFDGYFYDKYSLTTFEVLLALLENVNVFGASSMGALRALELDNYGMHGSGYVYEFLKRHEIAPYHVVAQTYDEENQPATEPLIAINRFLEMAEQAEVIGSSDRERCYATAENIHFSQLTYSTFFAHLDRDASIRSGVASRLKEFYSVRGRAAFDVKRQDALALLKSFRKVARKQGADHTLRTLVGAKEKYLAVLRSKYSERLDASLSVTWQEGPRASQFVGRERSIADTISLARRFFADLDVIVSDTSRFDQTNYFMINVVFIPFFFLDYGLSTGSGYGQTKEDALVSAYGEVFERIPAGTLRQRFAKRKALRVPVFPFRRLPYYYSLPSQKAKAMVDRSGQLRDRRYLECTEVISGKRVALPTDGVRLPSTCGMAAGNSLLEAVAYGLCEVIEHDVYAVYETYALMRQLRHLNVDSAMIRDENVQELLAELRGRGYRINFYNLLNRYGLPVIFCTLYEADRRWVFCGVSCRVDLEGAMVRSFQEALNGHYVSYIGSRDDKHAMGSACASEPQCYLNEIDGKPRVFERSHQIAQSPSQILDVLLERLRRCGIERVLVANLSPNEEWKLKAVKVIVPGLDLRQRRGGRPSPYFYEKCIQTHRIIAQATGGPPIAERALRPGALEREFQLPFKRFVIA